MSGLHRVMRVSRVLGFQTKGSAFKDPYAKDCRVWGEK